VFAGERGRLDAGMEEEGSGSRKEEQEQEGGP